MKSLILLSLVIMLAGCASQPIFKKPGPVPNSVESMGSYTLIHLKDGRIIRIKPNDIFVISERSPEGVVKRETPMGQIRIPLDACQCNNYQMVDCYKSEEDLNKAYMGYFNEELQKILGQP